MRASSHTLLKLSTPHTNQRHWISNEKASEDDGEWEHSVILLKPNSTDSRFEDIVLHEDDCEGMRVVGEFVTVLEE
ncbi:MAG: hypothetical protein HRU38_26450 [Saccharospirillaceae bacterium]|nr:hypothetical protein [Saccharospirillaceae bacterium]